MDEITKELLDALQDCERVMSAELKGLLVIQPELEKARAAIAKAEAILVATQSDDGWIPWGGGACPVEVGTRVDAKFRDGEKAYNVPAGGFAEDPDSRSASDWSHMEIDYDIVAYRVVMP